MTTVSRCKPCVPRLGEGQALPLPEILRAGFGPVSEALRGRGAKQDKRRGRKRPTSTHNRPQCGQLRGIPGGQSWGQTQREGTSLRSFCRKPYGHKEKTGVSPGKGGCL